MSEIVSLLEKDDGIFLGSLSPRLVKAYCEQIGFITDVKHNISRSAFAGVMDAARNSILDWSLKLEEAGVHGEGISFSKAETEKARAVTINIGNIGNAVGFGSFGDNATVTAKQTLSSQELVNSVNNLVNEAERLLPNSGLPSNVRQEASEILAELRREASGQKPNPSRLQNGLRSLKVVMEQAAGTVVGAGIFALISQVHSAL